MIVANYFIKSSIIRWLIHQIYFGFFFFLVEHAKAVYLILNLVDETAAYLMISDGKENWWFYGYHLSKMNQRRLRCSYRARDAVNSAKVQISVFS